MKKWYEELFTNYGRTYDNEVFTKGTIGECDFLEKELNYDKSLKILDIGCGTGRHSIELTMRGYSVTGVDLSASQLAVAKEKAEKQGLKIDFRKEDARNLPFNAEFDAAIMLCEGGFPLMETDEMNFEILSGAASSLRKGGKLIFTTLNGLFPLFHQVKDFLNADKPDGNASYGESNFDLMTFRDHSSITYTDDDGKEKTLTTNERYYVPSEITWMLKSLGFTDVYICGARLGEFSREHTLTTEDYEMLIIARL
ncbi:class I SAM-dependent methyltransferase [Myxococcota bacterium]|nr:class I SAM-dependent methyltransferase [Myxococcota bacterium]MBU1379923.1 class I SAM-dependent methyltransferase [Myxococcota bacterium]MBU1497392.1 class I SAM-dependent methyltransferase [Myxococcota bacterium]